MTKILMALILTVALAFPAATAPAADADAQRVESSAGEIVLDIVIVRPLGLAAIVLGTGIFIAGLPFTIPSGSVGTAARKLVAEPFKYTFIRPLGFEEEH